MAGCTFRSINLRDARRHFVQHKRYSYKISRFVFPVETRSPVIRDTRRRTASSYPERIARKTDLEFYIAPFFLQARQSSAAVKIQ